MEKSPRNKMMTSRSYERKRSPQKRRRFYYPGGFVEARTLDEASKIISKINNK